MQLVFKKGFDGDMEKLPKREVEGSVQFKEFESMEKLSTVANLLALGIMLVLAVPIIKNVIDGLRAGLELRLSRLVLLLVLEILTIPVHEVLHALCFKGYVEFYTYLRKGLAFVIGTESMTKGHFVFMSLLPNLVLGVLPFILYFFVPRAFWLGIWAAGNIGAGAGDYINIYNALRQVPDGALIYMSGVHTYWYMPEK